MADFRNFAGDDFFRRRLYPPLVNQLIELKEVVKSWPVSKEPDQVCWALGNKKKFTTKSVYVYLERQLAGCDIRWIWKAKIPLKI